MVTNPAARDAWRRWVSYLVSRYGAFPNVMFQMGNEPPGDGCRLGGARWGEFDTFTSKTVKSTAVYDVLYSSGAPVGGGVHQGDYNTYHPTTPGYSAAKFYSPTKGKPHHNEEIKAYSGGGDVTPWTNGARYVKFASFVAGGHASALVMWTADVMMVEYKKSSISLHNFVRPVLGDLFSLKVDDAFIVESPAEFCKGLASEEHFMLYMQKGRGRAKGANAPLGAQLVLKVPNGDARVYWFDPVAGRYAPPKTITVTDGILRLDPPEFTDDCALRISLVPPATPKKR